MPVYSITEQVGIDAGLLDGELSSKGIRVALTDLLIGATELDLGYAVGTQMNATSTRFPTSKSFAYSAPPPKTQAPAPVKTDTFTMSDTNPRGKQEVEPPPWCGQNKAATLPRSGGFLLPAGRRDQTRLRLVR